MSGISVPNFVYLQLPKQVRLHAAVRDAVKEKWESRDTHGVSHRRVLKAVKFPEIQPLDVLKALDSGERVATRIAVTEADRGTDGFKSGADEVHHLYYIEMWSEQTSEGVRFHVEVYARWDADQRVQDELE